jgi:hypothetical protein
VTIDSSGGYEVLHLPGQSGAPTPGWELFWVDDFLAGRRPAIDAEQAALITQVALAARQADQAGRPATL